MNGWLGLELVADVAFSWPSHSPLTGTAWPATGLHTESQVCTFSTWRPRLSGFATEVLRPWHDFVAFGEMGQHALRHRRDGVPLFNRDVSLCNTKLRGKDLSLSAEAKACMCAINQSDCEADGIWPVHFRRTLLLLNVVVLRMVGLICTCPLQQPLCCGKSIDSLGQPKRADEARP